MSDVARKVAVILRLGAIDYYIYQCNSVMILHEKEQKTRFTFVLSP